MKVKIGLVGLGNHMLGGIYGMLLKLPVKLEAVCDIDGERLQRFSDLSGIPASKCYEDYHKMLQNENLDAVLCSGSAELHYQVAKAALMRGISVFVEKPPCLNYKQAVELADLQKENQCFGMAGFNRRFATSYRMMKEIIETKEFGKPYLYMAKYNSSAYRDEEFFVFNHITHHLDLMRYLCGEIREIRAEKIVLTSEKVGYHIRFVSESGIMGFLQSASLQCESYPAERVEITGDGTCVLVDNVKRLEYNRLVSPKIDGNPHLSEKDDALCWNYNHGHSSFYSHYGFERELGHFFESVREKRAPEHTLADMPGTMRLYEELKKNTVEISA